MRIVFTDLDATLLDHETYDWRPAKPALERLRAEGSPVVLCTSKTSAEVEMLWREIGLEAPFIVENGGGVFLPPAFHQAGQRVDAVQADFQVLNLGAPYAELRDCLKTDGHPLGARGFGDMSAEEVAATTGLDLADAERARQRSFTEPFLLDHESKLPELKAAAQTRGLTVTRGGRFFHLLGADQDKGRAVERVAALIDPQAGTFGLGDSPNDRGMLEAVDIAIIVPHPGRTPLSLSRQDVVHAPAPGPVGWNAAVLSLLDAQAE